jgi:CubicO group peptidase (beta-lactamase class C family)
MLIVGILGTVLACGGGIGTPAPQPPPASDAWTSVTAAVQAAQPQFTNGVALEVITPSGVVYSSSSTAAGSFDDTVVTPVASASKWVSATVLLRLVDQGVLSLDTKTKDLLVDRNGQPWSGNLGEATLRHLLSFTTGISGDNSRSELTLQLSEAVLRIYEDEAPTAAVPGSYFYYGSTHLRIAARMAEVKTGKTWAQIFDEQLRIPLAWSSASTYGLTGNPNPAGTLSCTGREYLRFLAMELRGGLDGTTRLLPQSLLDQQRQDQYGATTTIQFSPYSAVDPTKKFHYGLCNWLETSDSTQPPSATNPILRVSSTGKFGWAPWVAMDGSFAALIITRQDSSMSEAFLPSENLKLQLDPLIRAALAQHPPVIRTIP